MQDHGRIDEAGVRVVVVRRPGNDIPPRSVDPHDVPAAVGILNQDIEPIGRATGRIHGQYTGLRALLRKRGHSPADRLERHRLRWRREQRVVEFPVVDHQDAGPRLDKPYAQERQADPSVQST
jgi:hypothetical protein